MKAVKNACRFIFTIFAAASLILGIYLIFGNCGIIAVNEATNGIGLFDLRFSYTDDMISTVISKFDGNPIEFFSQFYIFNDIFAAVFAVAAISFTILINRNDFFYLIYRSSLFSAAAHCFFDIVENFVILKIVNNYPFFTGNDSNLASGMTSIKWVFFWIWAVSTLILAVIAVYYMIKNKPAKGKRYKT